MVPIYTILTISVYFCTLQSAESVTSMCFECTGLTNPDDCKAFHPCTDGQRCYKEVEETDNGTASYNWGCASPELCQLESGVAAKKKRISIERCFECCDGNFCNFGACTRDYCSQVTCQNGAPCTNSALKAVCDCPNGYTGDLCEIEIQECNSNPCQNGATCNDKIGEYTCTCVTGYQGVNCEIDIDDCASKPCQNDNLCVDGVNSFKCVCQPGYTGTLCEINIDECASSPCLYQGTCIDLVDKYSCVCIPGITGKNCEINIDECDGVDCQNNGTCVDSINRFTCNCDYGFSGKYCEQALGRVCYNCTNSGSVDICNDRTICGKDEECYMEHELTAPGKFNFNLGCVPTSMCSYFQSNGKRDAVALQLCYECCDVNGCNHHACIDTRGPQING